MGGERPEPVTLIAIYQFMTGVVLLLLSCMLVVAAVPAFIFSAGSMEGVALVSLLGAAALSLMIVFGTASLVVGWGLLGLRRWARLAAIVLALFALVAFPIWTIAGALVLVYLLSPEARRVFNGEPLDDETDESEAGPEDAGPSEDPIDVTPPRIVTMRRHASDPADDQPLDPERTRIMPAATPEELSDNDRTRRMNPATDPTREIRPTRQDPPDDEPAR